MSELKPEILQCNFHYKIDFFSSKTILQGPGFFETFLEGKIFDFQNNPKDLVPLITEET